MTSLCQLGPLVFRINPRDISWNFEIHTNVIQTVGGRVVQVTGATLSDLLIQGEYGENRLAHAQFNNGTEVSPGRSWRMADAFAEQIYQLMNQQSPPAGSGVGGYTPPKTWRFYYPPKGWDFQVYIKSLDDPQGGGVVSHSTGKFAYDYALTLFPVADNTLHLTGDQFSLALQSAKDQAIKTAIARISAGIGWHKSGYNQPDLDAAIKGNTSKGADPTPSPLSQLSTNNSATRNAALGGG